MKYIISISIFVFIASNLFAQHDSLVIKYFDKIVPYDSLHAISDLQEDSIFILKLSGFDYLGNPFNNNEELEFVEKRFGFLFKYEHFKAPMEFVQKKQNEYNRQVYKYLDSIMQINSAEEINIELKRLGLERLIFAKQTDEGIKKYIEKVFNEENKEFNNKLIEADKLYRDRKFEKALEKYQELKNQTETRKGLLYLQTCEYHCFMNLKQYENAKLLIKFGINRITKRIKL